MEPPLYTGPIVDPNIKMRCNSIGFWGLGFRERELVEKAIKGNVRKPCSDATALPLD